MDDCSRVQACTTRGPKMCAGRNPLVNRAPRDGTRLSVMDLTSENLLVARALTTLEITQSLDCRDRSSSSRSRMEAASPWWLGGYRPDACPRPRRASPGVRTLSPRSACRLVAGCVNDDHGPAVAASRVLATVPTYAP